MPAMAAATVVASTAEAVDAAVAAINAVFAEEAGVDLCLCRSHFRAVLGLRAASLESLENGVFPFASPLGLQYRLGSAALMSARFHDCLFL
jgi:hypothetical protein